jgi:hypothetical protein
MLFTRLTALDLLCERKATGKFAGYTEAVWNPNRPEILSQA